jgi:tetratricopeptide (TPR) repeat protein
VEHTLKTISTSGIDEAISKIQLYRYLNEPEEAESICQDILAADPENQMAIRYLGLALTDQFAGLSGDRHTEAEKAFQRLTDPYERLYYLGLLLERRAKTQMRAGIPARAWIPLLKDAMRDFEEAEKIRPAGNDDAILRWNRCVRILQTLPYVVSEQQGEFIGDEDSAPVQLPRSSRASR